MSTLNFKKSGVSIIFAVFTLLLLSVVAAAIFSLVSSDIESAASKVNLSRGLGTAEAGIQIGTQAIRDDLNAPIQTDTPTDNGYHDLVYLEGYSFSGSSGSDYSGACLHGNNWNNPTPRFCSLDAAVGADVTIWDFKQKRNLIGTRIKDVEIVIRAKRRAEGEGDDPELQLEYTTDGGVVWAALGSPLVINNINWTEGDTTASYRSIPFGTLIDWNTFMNGSENFRIRARRINGGGNKECDIDWLSLRVTVEIDAQTEEWYSDWMNTDGTPKIVNMALGNSQIVSVCIADESGKVHLNYASEGLLKHLLWYNDVPVPLGLEVHIVTYREDIKLFDSVEELRKVPTMTDKYYNRIVQDLTVYPWVNNDTTRPASPRAPVNINTASENVLKAIFRCAIVNKRRINNLVSDIIARRETAPFTHMYSTYAIQPATRDEKSFAGFLQSRDYLDDDEKNQIRANADTTFLNRSAQPDEDWTGEDQTATEFCYYSNAFLVTSEGKVEELSRRFRTTYGDTYDYSNYSLSANSTFKLSTYIGDTNPQAYWREIR